MRLSSLLAVPSIGFLCLLVFSVPAQTSEVKVLSAIAIQVVMDDLGPKFERATGHKPAIRFATLGAVIKRVHAGEPADVVVIPRQGIDGLVKDSKAIPDTVTVVARSSIAVAVRKGAPKPDISSPEALKRTLLAAKSITYSDPARGGASGMHFAGVLDRLGIANEVKTKTVFCTAACTPDSVGLTVANSEAEIGVHQWQEFVSIAGIDVVGPLPGDLQNTIVFAAAVMADAKDVEASKAFVNFLRTPEAAAVFNAKGMEAATP